MLILQKQSWINYALFLSFFSHPEQFSDVRMNVICKFFTAVLSIKMEW